MNNNTPPYYPEYPQEDEIDLIALFKTIMSGWKIWISTTLIAMTSAFVYNHYAPPLYEASMTFFIPGGSAESSALRSYAAILGSSLPANIEDQVLAIAESQRIRLSVTETIAQQYPKAFVAFEKKQEKPIPEALRIETFASAVLKLDKKLNAAKNNTGLFRLTYENTDPKVAKAVVEEYLATLSFIYQELELSSEREIIKVLDAPGVSSLPVKPKKALNLALSLVCGLGIGTLIILIRMGFTPQKTDASSSTGV